MSCAFKVEIQNTRTESIQKGKRQWHRCNSSSAAELYDSLHHLELHMRSSVFFSIWILRPLSNGRRWSVPKCDRLIISLRWQLASAEVYEPPRKRGVFQPGALPL